MCKNYTRREILQRTGSNPVLTTMSKRYSESLVQDSLNNGPGLDWESPIVPSRGTPVLTRRHVV